MFVRNCGHITRVECVVIGLWVLVVIHVVWTLKVWDFKLLMGSALNLILAATTAVKHTSWTTLVWSVRTLRWCISLMVIHFIIHLWYLWPCHLIARLVQLSSSIEKVVNLAHIIFSWWRHQKLTTSHVVRCTLRSRRIVTERYSAKIRHDHLAHAVYRDQTNLVVLVKLVAVRGIEHDFE